MCNNKVKYYLDTKSHIDTTAQYNPFIPLVEQPCERISVILGANGSGKSHFLVIVSQTGGAGAEPPKKTSFRSASLSERDGVSKGCALWIPFKSPWRRNRLQTQ